MCRCRSRRGCRLYARRPADKAVSEARERVRAALIASGLALPARRITVNLAPADLPKEGSHYDLPIALGLMAAIGAIPHDALAGFTVLGELALDGSIAAVAGVLPAAIGANARGEGLICPAACGAGGGLGEPRDGDPRGRLADPARQPFQGHAGAVAAAAEDAARSTASPLDLRDIKGQESAKRALEIAAAGGHNLLMVGPPGAGKSMLAARLPSILPPLAPGELLEVSMIASVAGVIDGGALTSAAAVPRARIIPPACRRWSAAACARGPARSRSRITACCFSTSCRNSSRAVLDSLRQPLETGEVAIARANHRVTYPARFMLVAAMNPCRCGHASEPGYACKRGPKTLRRRLSGAALRPAARPHRSAHRGAGGDRRRPHPAAAGGRQPRSRRARRRARATSRRRAMPRSACRMCAPMPRRRPRCSKRSRGPTPAG